MKHVTKQKMPTRLFAAIVLAALLVVITVATVVVTVLAYGDDGDTGGQAAVTPPPEILADEALQNGLALAYPMINNKLQIEHIEVEHPLLDDKGNAVLDEEGNVKRTKFGFLKYNNDNYLTLYYFEEGSDEPIAYMPEICESESGFNYSSLFAIETGDGYSQYTLVDYLCMALQSPYFDGRIEISENAADKEAQFKEYGFDEANVQRVIVNYTDAFGEAASHVIKIGRKSATGTGHYFMVDERPYIYTSLNNFFDYALKNMTEFVKPLIVAEGLPDDNGFGPYLTTDYRQWLNTYHDGSCECRDKYTCPCKGKCTPDTCICDTARTTVTDDSSKVIAYTDVISNVLGALSDEYGNTGVDLIEIDLMNAKEWLESAKKDYDAFYAKYESYANEYERYKLDYEKLIVSEEYEKLGEIEKANKYKEYETYVAAFEKYKKNFENYKINYENQKKNYERMINALAGREIGKYEGASEIIYTIASYGKILDFNGKASLTYKYHITEIEAVLTDSGEISLAGVSAKDIGSSLIRVTYTASVDGKAVSDKEMHAVLDLNSVALSTYDKNRISEAGVGECNIEFTVNYTADNAFTRTGKYTVVAITEIYDSKGKKIETVTADSTVGFRYEIEVDGVYAGESSMLLDLSGVETKIKNLFKGKKVGAVSFTLEEQSVAYEMLMDFSTYKISEIKSFLTRELISAFRFQNSSERDPYYGGSLYENLMNDEHKLYGLNYTVCETVAKILGGLSDESQTGTADGLSGDGVVAVGITPEIKEHYGLYAHTIYFELPREITAYAPEGEEDNLEALDDYKYNRVLGFYLYVSDVDPKTNTRYIASDLYDVVTRVPAADFVFLNYDFESFWARRELILMDVANINYFGIEFNLEDFKGDYLFELFQPKNEDQNLEVLVTKEGECTPNKLTEYLGDPRNEGIAGLTGFYEAMSGASIEDYKEVLPDSLGVANFREAMRMLFFMSCVDVLPEEDRVGKAENMIMRITLKLGQDVKNASPYTYVYEFYTLDNYDRRILVSIHQENDYGERVGDMQVSDFYISMFTFKKIVNNFDGILNAEIITPNVGYTDDVIKSGK